MNQRLRTQAASDQAWKAAEEHYQAIADLSRDRSLPLVAQLCVNLVAGELAFRIAERAEATP